MNDFFNVLWKKIPRSNNSIEEWHNAFAKCVVVVHPSVTKLAEKIRRE